MGYIIDITGRKIGTWTVIRRNGTMPCRAPLWLCRCMCGREVTLRGANLRKNYVPVCECQASVADNEIWRDIEGYKDYYRVSRHGEVKSLQRTVVTSTGQTQTMREKLLSLTDGSHGYLGCVLCRNGVTNTVLVHHLVAKEFIGDRPANHIVHHKDGDKHNNTLDNLEYKFELDHVSDHNRGHIRNKRILTDDQVISIYKLAHQGGMTQDKIGEMFGVRFWMVSAIKNKTTRAELTDTVDLEEKA